MKFKAEGWVFAMAALAIAGILFIPVAALKDPTAALEDFDPALLTRAMAWCLFVVGFWGFKSRFWPKDTQESRRWLSGPLLLVAQAVLVRGTGELLSRDLLSWTWLPLEPWIWTPWFLVTGLTGILLGRRFGLLTCLTGGLMIYLFADPGPWPLVGCVMAPLAGILLLRRSPTRGRVLRAGLGAGLTLGVVAAIHQGIAGEAVDGISAAVLVPVAIGLLSAFLSLAILPVLEWLLGELSDVTLVEYGTDHALLDRLRQEAPGTWHHSLNVADLAEKAAAEIGARALFCKTSALYHDIGKLAEPALFAENTDGPSPHDQMDPLTSAQRIIGHVTHGVELSRKYGLPRAFREIIVEHHGISTVRFFYAKACEPLPDGTPPTVDRSAFTYPGPSPSTRESGIIALADAVEAASRSLQAKTEPELRAFVRGLIADRISEGELAQCPLTLAELARVEAAFISWLKGRNHLRPAYPGRVAETVAIGESAVEGHSATQPA